jgi:hypothetical protein
LDKRRSKLFNVVFAIIVVILFVASAIPVSKTVANQTQTDVNQRVSNLQTSDILMQFIFGNNLMLCLIMFLPFAGAGFGFFAIYNTGKILGAEAIAQNTNFFAMNLSLYATPVFWLEFIAYSIAITESMVFTYYAITHRFRDELPKLGIAIGICAVILFTGAVVETLMIDGYVVEAYGLFFLTVIGVSVFKLMLKYREGKRKKALLTMITSVIQGEK